jgi:DNA-binding response OmpR family regulator
MSTNRISKRLQDAMVLIVDDDVDILSSIELAMRVEGARTETCTDGNTAVSLCAALDPDLVILDMMLPRRSGFLVLEKIIESGAPPPVIMITANEGRRHMAYAQSLGVSAYFNKPVPLERLVTTAAELLADAPGAAASEEAGEQA